MNDNNAENNKNRRDGDKNKSKGERERKKTKGEGGEASQMGHHRWGMPQSNSETRARCVHVYACARKSEKPEAGVN